MSSTLIVAPVERLQKRIIAAVNDLNETPGVYIMLNKPWTGTATMLGEPRTNVFFIDCVSAERLPQDVIHVAPDDLDLLAIAIKEYMRLIPGKKFLFIDSLATLLIYNMENNVARFIQAVTTSLEEDVKVIACSPAAEGNVLFDKVFNFFDTVEEIER